jgi:hypothetical protein
MSPDAAPKVTTVQLLDLFVWMEKTPVAVYIQDTTLTLPLLEVFHLFGLTLLLGSILVVDARLIGVPIQRRAASRLAADVAPCVTMGLALMVLSGLPLLAAEAVKCYNNPAFWWKMSFLGAALIFHCTVRHRVLLAEHVGRTRASLTGGVSLCLWFAVGLSGRAIAFV